MTIMINTSKDEFGADVYQFITRGVEYTVVSGHGVNNDQFLVISERLSGSFGMQQKIMTLTEMSNRSKALEHLAILIAAQPVQENNPDENEKCYSVSTETDEDNMVFEQECEALVQEQVKLSRDMYGEKWVPYYAQEFLEHRLLFQEGDYKTYLDKCEEILQRLNED